MPCHPFLSVPGAAVFVTVALLDRSSRLLVEVERLRHAVRVTRSERPFGVGAWVVLPDHLHGVWRLPLGDADHATRWRLITSRFSHGLPIGARRASHAARGERGPWQRRFRERHVRDDDKWAACVRYCWLNPVKHDLVAGPEEWSYSSFRRRP